MCGNAFGPLEPEAGGALAEADDAPPLALSPVAVVRLGPFGADCEKVLCVSQEFTIISECDVKWGDDDLASLAARRTEEEKKRRTCWSSAAARMSIIAGLPAYLVEMSWRNLIPISNASDDVNDARRSASAEARAAASKDI